MRTKRGKNITIGYKADLSGDCIIMQDDIQLEVPFSELEKIVTDIRNEVKRENLIRLAEQVPNKYLTVCSKVLECYMEDEKHGKK